MYRLCMLYMLCISVCLWRRLGCLSGIFRSPEVSLAKAMPAKLSQPFAGVAPGCYAKIS